MHPNGPKDGGPVAPNAAHSSNATFLKRLASFHGASQIAPRFRVGVLHSYLRTQPGANPAGDCFSGGPGAACAGLKALIGRMNGL